MKTITIVVLATLLGAVLLGGGVWIGQAMFRSAAASSWHYGGMMRGDMMGAFGSSNAEPLTIEETTQAVERFLENIGLEGFEVAEVMIFDNHAYAEVMDDNLNGAFEVLIDPATLSVTLEHGPAMMWNIEYGMMGGRGSMMGGSSSMMGAWVYEDSGNAISAGEAVGIAQNYLDRYRPALTADEHADAFPGYYTIHTLLKGEVEGMLSVNAYTGAVWYHTWHGELIEMVEHEE